MVPCETSLPLRAPPPPEQAPGVFLRHLRAPVHNKGCPSPLHSPRVPFPESVFWPRKVNSGHKVIVNLLIGWPERVRRLLRLACSPRCPCHRGLGVSLERLGQIEQLADRD